jgi:FlaA1/EpsC-like NDP-sugar epimerase
MEANPLEAIRNNAIATRVTAETAVASGCERFVLVSTDKAVTPRTVMGASKAMAEWIVEAAGRKHPQTRFVTVRFGNVLASSGSVVPIFRSQIERGGPVTVTDPEMTRYFMTIPEAVQLVIRSGDLGGASGEVFVLEMGDPVKIVDLAHNMIRLAGYEPEVDIAIEFVGARPGEKVHEELFNSDERPQPTAADRIVRAVRKAPRDPEWVNGTLSRLEALVGSGDEAELAAQTVELVTQRRAAALPVDDVTA